VPVILESTRSVGDSYIFSTTLQPSIFGSTFTLLGILFFLKTKYLISGILLAIAGYMHTNFLLLSFVYIGLAHIFIGKENFLPRTIKQFTPLLIILVIKLPILFAMISSENGELATYIFQFIRSPFHYVPNTYLMDFYLICGWSIVGIASIYILNVEEALKRHLIAIYASLLIFVLIATLLTTVTFIPFISKLFVWRIAPFCNLLSQIFFVSALINFAFQQSNNSPNKHLLSIGLIGIGGLFIFRWYAYAYGITAFNTFLIIGLFGFLLILTSRNYLDRFLGSINLQTVKYLSMALVGLSLIYGYNSYFFKISSFVNNYPGTAEKQLYSWVKSSPENSIFVTSLELDSFRILGERAVVVDWRSTPVDPDGLIEWYKRVEDVSGVNEFKNLEDAQNGYLTMDAARLENLKDLYSADYAVLFNNQNISLLNFKTVYKNEKYAVLAIE